MVYLPNSSRILFINKYLFIYTKKFRKFSTKKFREFNSSIIIVVRIEDSPVRLGKVYIAWYLH